MFKDMIEAVADWLEETFPKAYEFLFGAEIDSLWLATPDSYEMAMDVRNGMRKEFPDATPIRVRIAERLSFPDEGVEEELRGNVVVILSTYSGGLLRKPFVREARLRFKT